MINDTDVPTLIGRTAVDADGNKIGKVEQVYLDDASGAPKWVTVSTGLFGTKESFAPLEGAALDGDDVRLTVDKDLVKEAPQVESDGHLDDAENEQLYRHYAGHLGESAQAGNDTVGRSNDADRRGDGAAGARHSDRTADTPAAGPVNEEDQAGHDVSGPNTDDAMTRSEERMNVGTQQVEAGRARLRKYVVTENVTKTVPVSHEEVRVEREPITDANRGAATDGADISEEEHEVTLHAEQPVVEKETVPVERVRLGTETVTEEQTVSDEVRKEQIDAPDTDR